MKLAFLLWLATIAPQPAADQICLATTVYLEARSESTRGQMAVAEVAMRRRDSGRWGTTVCDVVRAPGQFALTVGSPERILRNPVAWQKAWHVAGQTLDMWAKPRDQRQFVVPHADSFATVDIAPYWTKGPPLATIGSHSFYRVN
ncbi:cell wall hydrolase [Dokdonella sp.]|uniref:cell wall hydrolase n=1 Tax=Dokdonella sp. TaxID=2291710 RepID=UPI0031CB9793|nr:cell wall hydrolase [Dokdonella sp.]